MKQRLFLYASIIALTLGGAVAQADDSSSSSSSDNSGGSSAGVAGGSVGAASNTAAGGTSPSSGTPGGGPTANTPGGPGGVADSSAGVAGDAPTSASNVGSTDSPSERTTLTRYRGMEDNDTTEVMAGMTQSDLEGHSIMTANGEDIGEIDQVLVDSTGDAYRVLVDVGGFLGIGERQVAIDPSDLRISPDNDQIRIDMTKAQIESLPTYEEDDQGWWSGMTN